MSKEIKQYKHLSIFECHRLEEKVSVVYVEEEDENKIRFLECKREKLPICDGCICYNLLKQTSE
jgi:hypothetical protein